MKQDRDAYLTEEKSNESMHTRSSSVRRRLRNLFYHLVQPGSASFGKPFRFYRAVAEAQ